jgi:hypothetical protein
MSLVWQDATKPDFKRERAWWDAKAAAEERDGSDEALAESCRVAGKTLILAVSHRAQMIPVWVSGSLADVGRLVPAVAAMADRGQWHQEDYLANALLTRGMTQNYMGAFRAFLPHELREILEAEGMVVQRCGGLGTLAGLCERDAVAKVMQDKDLLDEFLDL